MRWWCNRERMASRNAPSSARTATKRARDCREGFGRAAARSCGATGRQAASLAAGRRAAAAGAAQRIEEVEVHAMSFGSYVGPRCASAVHVVHLHLEVEAVRGDGVKDTLTCLRPPDGESTTALSEAAAAVGACSVRGGGGDDS